MKTPAQEIIELAFVTMLKQEYTKLPAWENNLTPHEASCWLRDIASGEYRLTFMERPDGVFIPSLR